MLFMMLMMFAFNCLTDKYRCKHGKYEGLDKCHQYLDKINKYRKCDRKRCRAPACILTHVPKNKYQRNQTDDNNMTCYHICKQTNNQSKRLNKYTDKFNRNEYKFY